MLYIELAPLENGAHANQRTDDILQLPEGWAVVPLELEEEAWGYLPFINLEVRQGKIVGVSQGPIPEPVPQPHVYSEYELLQQTITDHELDLIEQGQQITDLELKVLMGN